MRKVVSIEFVVDVLDLDAVDELSRICWGFLRSISEDFGVSGRIVNWDEGAVADATVEEN